MGSKDAKVVLTAHSMGGLVARCFAETMGGAPTVRQTITLGTPFFGAVKAAYLLNAPGRPGIAPSGSPARTRPDPSRRPRSPAVVPVRGRCWGAATDPG